MKVKELIELLKTLEQEKEIIMNSDYPYISEVEDLGKTYCIFGEEVRKAE